MKWWSNQASAIIVGAGAHLRPETTTIYTKVAVFRQRQIQSPLDVLTGKAPARPPQAVARPVGRLQLQFTPRAGELAADVKLVVLSEDRYVHLTGIVVRQPRAGRITLEIPPLESWERPMRWLTREQRQRMESPDFYRLLQEHIGRRYLTLARPAS